jgi:Cu-processing system ATP-binding protein
MGNNGAGKSTFINYILGFYTSLDQHPFLENFSKEFQPLKRGEFGYSPEIATLDTNLNGNDYIQMVSKLRGVETSSENIFKELALNISPKRAIREYSKGMRQRLSLGLASIGDPKYLVLDEPTSGLDRFGEDIVIEFLRKNRWKFHYIISTHSLRLALESRDNILFFKSGEIIDRLESPETLKEIEDKLISLY